MAGRGQAASPEACVGPPWSPCRRGSPPGGRAPVHQHPCGQSRGPAPWPEAAVPWALPAALLRAVGSPAHPGPPRARLAVRGGAPPPPAPPVLPLRHSGCRSLPRDAQGSPHSSRCSARCGVTSDLTGSSSCTCPPVTKEAVSRELAVLEAERAGSSLPGRALWLPRTDAAGAGRGRVLAVLGPDCPRERRARAGASQDPVAPAWPWRPQVVPAVHRECVRACACLAGSPVAVPGTGMLPTPWVHPPPCRPLGLHSFG